jgi:hypothetical protein
MSPGVMSLVFVAAMIALASALLGGLYLLLRREPMPDKKTLKKIIVSNVR